MYFRSSAYRVRAIQYFSYIMTVSFIDGGNQGTRRKPTDLPQLTLSHNVVSTTPHYERIRTHFSGDWH